MGVEVNDRPNDEALNLMEELESLPEEANFAELSIQVSKKVNKQGLLKTIDYYKNKFGGTDKLDTTRFAIDYMTEGGDTKLFTISFSQDRSKVDFIGLAVRMPKPGVVDYCICTYTYQEPFKNVTVEDSVTKFIQRKFLFWDLEPEQITTTTTKVVQQGVPISHRVRTCLEAAFYYELTRRGMLAIDRKQKKFELTF